MSSANTMTMNTAVFFLLGVAASTCMAQVPQCPGELSANSIQVRPAPGWTGVVTTRLLLSGAGIVNGRPDVEPRAELRGDTRQISKQVTQTAYPGLAGTEKWLICAYGQGGELEQAYRLPAAADHCLIRVARNRNKDITISISCTTIQ
ncbi:MULTISPECIES: STY0301 family protein [unclassified Janthinobacterium]|uniref:STY0301 family protein n=1 Tax=unclassified Janthinobacterium TaxID=2610881 RepID=UPI00160EFDF4|nr:MULTISPECIES: STY0301 family protein [unclassified Janthinobacterium]MBB5607421.1 hypothetical protein [Janthinobacterium sp. S3T4]MBB5612442.1 hypothetical protein [Janthinobacterium sp. S3M3]